MTVDAQRFWARVELGSSDECWPWSKACTTAGYGSLRDGYTVVYAHRTAYELTYGPLRKDDCVMHTCDNPPCCNPAHLMRGSKLTNNRDCAKKQRGNVGTRAPQSRLDDDSVRAIRAAYAGGEAQHVLATRFGVSQMTISKVVRQVTWRHITDQE